MMRIVSTFCFVLFITVGITHGYSQNCENIKLLELTKQFIAKPLAIIDEKDVM